MNRIPLLLADPSPCLRLLVLKELLQKPDSDPEVEELQTMMNDDPLIADLINLQGSDGSWKENELAGSIYNTLITTAMILARFAFLGFTEDHPTVKKGVEFRFSHQNKDESWPLPSKRVRSSLDKLEGPEGYDMIPLQTGIPLKSIAACGYATDPRAEHAYKWLLNQQLDDGAWPSGTSAGVYGFVAGYRRLPHSRWGCRTNTTFALSCLAHHPEYRSQKGAQHALDLIFGRETKEKHILGFEVARLIGIEPTRGFFTYYARFDVGFFLNLYVRIGASQTDERVASIVEFVLNQQGPFGLWEYPGYPQTARWVTLDLLRSLSQLNETSEWLSFEPRTPFQAYPKKEKRF